jgi:hypothetical protein
MINLLRYGLHGSRARYLCLHSPAHRADIALVRAPCRSLRATAHIFASLVTLSPLVWSHKPSPTVLRLSTIETRNQLDIFSEKGTANAPSRPELPI